MIDTFNDYQKEKKSLSYEQMKRLHAELAAEVGDDEDALELYEELMQKANRYADMRARWALMSREEKMDQDSFRTSLHDSVITHFNMLARYLRMQGKATAWRDELGDEKADPWCRKAIGDFGCYLVFVNSLLAR
ncbi:MAG: hypothetical protein LUE29_05525 [Lachnospiraceae bacterium]|nr:hypothetical protein [Lachnospiraceae bacterium]